MSILTKSIIPPPPPPPPLIEERLKTGLLSALSAAAMLLYACEAPTAAIAPPVKPAAPENYTTTVSGMVTIPPGTAKVHVWASTNPARKAAVTEVQPTYTLKVVHQGTFTITAGYTDSEGRDKTATLKSIKTTVKSLPGNNITQEDWNKHIRTDQIVNALDKAKEALERSKKARSAAKTPEETEKAEEQRRNTLDETRKLWQEADAWKDGLSPEEQAALGGALSKLRITVNTIEILDELPKIDLTAADKAVKEAETLEQKNNAAAKAEAAFKAVEELEKKAKAWKETPGLTDEEQAAADKVFEEVEKKLREANKTKVSVEIQVKSAENLRGIEKQVQEQAEIYRTRMAEVNETIAAAKKALNDAKTPGEKEAALADAEAVLDEIKKLESDVKGWQDGTYDSLKAIKSSSTSIANETSAVRNAVNTAKAAMITQITLRDVKKIVKDLKEVGEDVDNAETLEEWREAATKAESALQAISAVKAEIERWKAEAGITEQEQAAAENTSRIVEIIVRDAAEIERRARTAADAEARKQDILEKTAKIETDLDAAEKAMNDAATPAQMRTAEARIKAISGGVSLKGRIQSILIDALGWKNRAGTDEERAAAEVAYNRAASLETRANALKAEIEAKILSKSKEAVLGGIAKIEADIAAAQEALNAAKTESQKKAAFEQAKAALKAISDLKAQADRMIKAASSSGIEGILEENRLQKAFAGISSIVSRARGVHTRAEAAVAGEEEKKKAEAARESRKNAAKNKLVNNSKEERDKGLLELVKIKKELEAIGGNEAEIEKINALTRGLDLRKANTGTSGEIRYLAGKDLSGVDLSGADLSRTTLIGTNFTNANLKNADFREANLDNAILKGADMEGVKMQIPSSGRYPIFVRLLEANLEGANLRNADLRGASFINANLKNADLRGADLRGANFKGANLQGAKFTGANMKRTGINDGVNFEKADLRGAQFNGADLSRGDFEEADLTNANLSGANLTGANFISANLTNANLSGSNLRESKLHNANLHNANLRSTDLHNAVFFEARNLPPRANWAGVKNLFTARFDPGKRPF